MRASLMQYVLYAFGFLMPGRLNAQVAIEGPVCITPGIPYQYNISNKGSDTSFRFCLTGGVISGTTNTCSDNGNYSSVQVTWTDSTGGTVTVTSASGTASLSVSIAKDFQPGAIDSSSKLQNVTAANVPIGIQCSPASGGSCSAVYVYQWFQSPDGVSWDPVNGVTSIQLDFTAPLTQTMYYRRKVMDQTGNTEGFSDIAIVTVTQP
jgi:hypothetical protein